MNLKTGKKPAFELILERLIDAPRERVWRAWAEPELIVWTGEFAFGPRDQIRTAGALAAEGKMTRVRARQTFAVLTPETEPATKGAKQGWTTTLDQLAEVAEAGR